MYGIELSADEKEIISCSRYLKIYRHNGEGFVLNQTIDIGFGCFEVNFMGELFEAHGFSHEIKFFEFNGTQYVPKLTLETS